MITCSAALVLLKPSGLNSVDPAVTLINIRAANETSRRLGLCFAVFLQNKASRIRYVPQTVEATSCCVRCERGLEPEPKMKKYAPSQPNN
jgi:hypothetical protein